MSTLLQLNTSLFSTSGQSSRLAEQFVARWRAAHPAGRVIVRDLARDPVPHLTAERFQAFLAKPDERTPAQQATIEQDRQWQSSATGSWDREALRRCVQLGGGSEEFFQDVFNELGAKFAREQKAIAAGNFHAASGSLFYLVSGRKR